ncbi:MAG: hypothetical protein RAP03_17280, partial [Candidatus Electryonea clarkiae]|nr:hypothetical protein [Candidatus Electryonea clarkiae]
AFRVSKRVKNGTAIGDGARSIPRAAVDMLLDKNPSPGRALVLGVNETTEIIVKTLARRGIETTLINRTDYAANKMALAYGITSASWTELPELVKNADMILSATASKDHVITKDMFTSIDSNSKRFLVDLAVPRDIEPAVNDIMGLELFDLQDLKYHLERIQDRRCTLLPDAQEIIEQQVDEFLEWLHSQSFSGGIEAVKSELHQAADEELNRFMSSFHKGEKKALEAFSHALIKRFLKIARHNYEPGDLGGLLVARTDPAAMETPGVSMTFMPSIPDDEIFANDDREGEKGS